MEEYAAENDQLRQRLEEAEQLIDAIRDGEVDAFAIANDSESKIYTLQTGDYAYRVLIEEFGEGALNVTEDGLIVYTNQAFCDLMQLPYEKVIGSHFADYVPAEFKELFSTLFKQALKGKSRGEISLKPDGRFIPVYISLTTLQPNLPTVGMVITDFSEKKKNEEIILQYQQNLEGKNRELLQSNAELASFAHIASHDLQEPLRKIQVFTNRILETEENDFKPTTTDYFNRIVNASKRMQHLIADLMEYSRLNNMENIFSTEALDDILRNVTTNLSDDIQEAGATIVSEGLPEMKIIPYQFVQLFSNLISNSLKYRNKEGIPVIRVSAREIDTRDADQQHASIAPGKYCMISFADNGIGFEPVYTEKIFDLFQRLHGKKEYEGTGVGLAICKKIMQNHGGYITAFGEPGKGAIFNLYLPLAIGGGC